MKGLIKKDLYMIQSYCKSYLLSFVVFLIFPLFSKEASFMSAYLFLLPSMCVVTLISYDEKNNWEVYFKQLPVSVKDTVLAKYIIGFMLSIIILCIYSICLYFRYDVSIIYSFMVMSIISFTSFAITLPFYFGFGSHTGRIAYYVSIGIIVFIAMQAQFNITAASPIIPNGINGIIPLIAFSIFVGSYFLSMILYKTRLNKLR